MSVPFVPFPLTAQLAIIGHVAAQDVVSVHHFNFPTTIGVSDLDDLNNEFMVAWGTYIAPQLSGSFVVDQIHSISLASNTAPSADLFPTIGNVGTVPVNPLTNNVALVVSYHTALRGRSYRGRTYQGGIPISAAFSSVLCTTTYRDDLVAAYVDLFADIFTNIAARHVIASRFQNGSWLTTGIATPVNAISGDTAFDSQRDRLQGRGS